MGKRFNIRRTIFFHDYYSRLKNIAMSVFEWEGLPESCSERFMEDTLFHYGRAIFVDDPDMGFLNLRVAPASELNVYNESVAYTAYSTGYSKYYKRSDCVYIRNNYVEKSTDYSVILFAEKLALLDVAIQINHNAQKTPLLIYCDPKTKASLEALYNQYEGDKPVVFGHKSLSEKPIQTLVTGAPFIADKLREEKSAVWNEALEFLGINTNPSDKKKERLITSEVDSNNEQIDIQAGTMLLCRQKACEEINKKYGLNVSVSRRVLNMNEDREPEQIETEGVLNDG